MPGFKRVPMPGSDEVFRATRPEPTVADFEPPGAGGHFLQLMPEELDLLIEAVQMARYPEKARPVLPLATFDRLAELRLKLEEARRQ